MQFDFRGFFAKMQLNQGGHELLFLFIKKLTEKGEIVMLVLYDLRRWLFMAKEDWASAAKENGDQTDDFGCKVFSDDFKRLIKEIAALELPASRSGKYVCDIRPEGGSIKVIWFEPPVNGCCSRGYDVCCLTYRDEYGAENFEQLWRTFIAKFKQGLGVQVKKTLLEFEDCQNRMENFYVARGGLDSMKIKF